MKKKKKENKGSSDLWIFFLLSLEWFNIVFFFDSLGTIGWSWNKTEENIRTKKAIAIICIIFSFFFLFVPFFLALKCKKKSQRERRRKGFNTIYKKHNYHKSCLIDSLPPSLPPIMCGGERGRREEGVSLTIVTWLILPVAYACLKD